MTTDYPTETTPETWLFGIWGFVFAWQLLWLLYAITLLCGTAADGCAYSNPMLFKSDFLLIFNINLGLNIGWIFLWDMLFRNAALGLMATQTFALFVCLYLSHRSLHQNADRLIKQGRRGAIWSMRLLTHNGLAFYAAWMSVLTILNLNIVLVYSSNPQISQEHAGLGTLGVLTLEIVFWFLLESCLLDRFVRYTFTPHIAILVSLIALAIRNWNLQSVIGIYILVLLILSGIMTYTKVVITSFRHRNTPLYPSTPEQISKYSTEAITRMWLSIRWVPDVTYWTLTYYPILFNVTWNRQSEKWLYPYHKIFTLNINVNIERCRPEYSFFICC